MAEDEERAARIGALKDGHPQLTWAKIAAQVGVSERAATQWRRTGALKPENAEALAKVFGVDFDYIWMGPRPDTPDLFVDRRQRQLKDEISGDLAGMLVEIQSHLAMQTEMLERIERAVQRGEELVTMMDEVTKRFLAASVDAASRELLGGTPLTAEAPEQPAT